MSAEIYRQRIALAKESLEDKWNKKSCIIITSKCPFCYHAIDSKEDWIIRGSSPESLCGNVSHCDFCLCDPKICSHFGERGFIDILNGKYTVSEFAVRKIDIDDLMHIRELFHQMIADSKAMIHAIEGGN